MKNVQKPLSVLRTEMYNNMLNMINSYGLPLCVVELVCNDILKDVQNQYEQESTQYKIAVLQAKSEEEKSKKEETKHKDDEQK